MGTPNFERRTSNGNVERRTSNVEREQNAARRTEHVERLMVPTVVVSARGADRVEGGHPWIYRSDVADVRASAGDRVTVLAPRGRPLGQALFSDRSQIAIR